MSRSEAVRQEVLELDGHRCQITGADSREVPLQVHHVYPLGIGGSEELDTVENGITLSEAIHMGGLHPGVSVPTVRILHWDRTDKEGGLIVERRDGVADEWHPWPKAELWFFKRQDAEMLEQEIDMVRTVQMVESRHARVIAHIWRNYQLVSDAASPAQFIAGLGLDSNRAKDEARASQWIQDNGLEWPDGVNLRKILLLISAGKELAHAQVWLDQSADASYSDLSKMLIEKGFKLASLRWYLLIGQSRRPLGRIQTDVLFVRSRDIEVVLARTEAKVLEINAFRSGIKWDRRAQKLFDGDGREIPFETWEKEEAK